MRESTIEKYLVMRVKAMGGEVRKVQWIGRRGAPDRLVMLPAMTDFSAPIVYHYPRTIWVELKATGQEAEPHQAREHYRMRDLGQHVVVIDSLAGVDGVLG
jgi:hypothetical protein